MGQIQKPEYPDIELLIGGSWRAGRDGRTIAVVDPATGKQIGHVAAASAADLEEAAAAAEAGFCLWGSILPHQRYLIMRKAAGLLAQRRDEIAAVMTLEQGKPVAQALDEIDGGVEVIDWFAEEARRLHHRLVPGREPGIEQIVMREPIGPVAAFTPWNFPVNQAVRKISAALAAGCSIVLKGPEDTPASCAALVAAFVDAGVPAGVIGLVFGNPAEISTYLICHPAIRKISFTGSTIVGKQLASLAGSHMKPATMELGGHGPVLIFPGADIERTIGIVVPAKYRNAGQVCTSPTRFVVHKDVFEPFAAAFEAAARTIKVGSGFDPDTRMGPLVHARRVEAVEALVADAVEKGADLRLGGRRLGNRGCFFEPTVLANTPVTARAMNEEPFGPIALINAYPSEEAMIAEANRLSYGLASYAYTGPACDTAALGMKLRAGMVSINHHSLGLPEVPFGGMRDSGYGTEGGPTAIDSYLIMKYITSYSSRDAGAQVG